MSAFPRQNANAGRTPWGNGGQGGFPTNNWQVSPSDNGVPWAGSNRPPNYGGARNSANVAQRAGGNMLPGVGQGGPSSGYITGPGGMRPVKPGERANLKLGESFVAGAPPGETSKGDQRVQAVQADYAGTVDAQKRAQGRYDQALNLFKTADAEQAAWQSDYEKKLMSKGQDADFSEAKKFTRDAVSGYEDRSAKDAAAASSGIDQQFNQQKQQLMTDPDFQNLPPEAQQQKLAQIDQQKFMQKQQALTGLFSKANEDLASLRMSAGGQMANITTAEAGLKNQRMATLHATHMLSENYRAQGRQAMAQLLTDYPDANVSRVDAMLQLSMFDNMGGNQERGYV